jgi:hypothetical protein
MQCQTQISGVGAIYAALAACSNRPRYAFLVLQLVAEAADRRGWSGPFVGRGLEQMLLRDWLCTQLFPLSEQSARRAGLRARVIVSLQGQLTGDVEVDAPRIKCAVEEQVLAVGRTNISRAISDLVRAGFVTRYYAGYATNHVNRGGKRHAVYLVPPSVLKALGKSAAMLDATTASAKRQGELFAT